MGLVGEMMVQSHNVVLFRYKKEIVEYFYILTYC